MCTDACRQTCDRNCTDADVGYELVEQSGYDSGAASIDLANAAHVDPEDDSRSFAIWVTSNPQLPPPTCWFFLLPDVGLAIELWDGVGISWDGRAVKHCTAVQQSDPRDALMSLFVAVPKHVIKQRDEEMEMRRAIRTRHLMKDLCPRLTCNEYVWVKRRSSVKRQKRKRNEPWSRRQGIVGAVDEHGLYVKWYKGKCGYQTYFEKQQVDNEMVRAGAIYKEMYTIDAPIEECIGRELYVYVAERDKVMHVHCSTVESDGNALFLMLLYGCETLKVRYGGRLNPPLCIADHVHT